jgi:hypothetical protein
MLLAPIASKGSSPAGDISRLANIAVQSALQRPCLAADTNDDRSAAQAFEVETSARNNCKTSV